MRKYISELSSLFSFTGFSYAVPISMSGIVLQRLFSQCGVNFTKSAVLSVCTGSDVIALVMIVIIMIIITIII